METLNLTMDEGVRYHIRKWPESPHLIVLLVHGLGCHGAYYEEFCSSLSASGPTIYLPDLRGFGLSGGERGHIASFWLWIQDLLTLIAHIRLEHPKAKIAVFGESLGAMLSLLLAREFAFSHVALAAPVLKRQVSPTSAQLFSFIWGFLASQGRQPCVYTGGRESLGSPNEAFNEQTNRDPLFVKTFSPGFLWQMHALTRQIIRHPLRSKTPIIFFQGTEDRISSAEYNRQFFKEIQSPHKQWIEIPGAWHCLIPDPIGRPVILDTLQKTFGVLGKRASGGRL
jgi:alpha-beta hydrolase superfamily lysophospholipase